ncbi:MAG: hypothetical protein AAFV88_10675 [Planctomycetota bacterium]
MNNPITRSTLLDLVHRSLQRDGMSTHELASVLREVMDAANKLSATKNVVFEHQVRCEEESTKPVPLVDVAAYVEGTLKDADEITRITSNALRDPGLLMEIVSAVLSQQTTPSVNTTKPSEASGPLPAELRARLLAIRPQPHPPSDETEAEPAKQPVEIRIAEAEPAERKKGKFHFWMGLAATAAAILIAAGWWAQSTNRDDGRAGVDVAQNGDRETNRTSDKRGRVNESFVRDDSSASSNQDEASKSDTINQTPFAQPDPLRDMIVESPRENGIGEEKNNDRAIAMEDSASDPMANKPDGDEPLGEGLVADWSVEWKQVDGLLLRGTSSGLANVSRSSGGILTSVAEGTQTTFGASMPDASLRLRTLPLCRAAATLDGRAGLVLAADSVVDLTRDGTLDLLYGSIALMDLADGQAIRVGRNRRESFVIQSVGAGSIRLEREGDGMQLDLHGSATVNGEGYENQRLVIDRPSERPQVKGDAPDKLPRWTRSTVDRIEVGRSILAQLSNGDDFNGSITRVLASGEVRGSAAVTLQKWLVAVNRSNLLRLIASPSAMVREAALNELNQVRPPDPRHGLLWRGLQAGSNNGRSFASLRLVFQDLWSGRRPNTARKEQLVRLLLSNDPATRASADYLLRSFYGSGPRFILNSSAAIRTRSASAWRSKISRLD